MVENHQATRLLFTYRRKMVKRGNDSVLSRCLLKNTQRLNFSVHKEQKPHGGQAAQPQAPPACALTLPPPPPPPPHPHPPGFRGNAPLPPRLCPTLTAGVTITAPANPKPRARPAVRRGPRPSGAGPWAGRTYDRVEKLQVCPGDRPTRRGTAHAAPSQPPPTPRGPNRPPRSPQSSAERESQPTTPFNSRGFDLTPETTPRPHCLSYRWLPQSASQAETSHPP